MPANGAKKSAGRRVFIMPTISTMGSGLRALISRSATAERGGAMGVVPTIEPDLGASREQARQRALKPHQPRRPVDGAEALGDIGIAHRQAEMAGGGDGERGVFELVRAEQRRWRQVEQPRLVLIDQPPIFGAAIEVFTHDQRRDTEPRCGAHQHGAAFVALAAIDGLGAAFEDAGLFGRRSG